MASGGNLCNTLFYQTLSKQKKGYFGLRLKAVFIFFVKSIFIARVFIKKKAITCSHFFMEADIIHPLLFAYSLTQKLGVVNSFCDEVSQT